MMLRNMAVIIEDAIMFIQDKTTVHNYDSSILSNIQLST